MGTVVRLVSPRGSELLDETWVGGVFRFCEQPYVPRECEVWAVDRGSAALEVAACEVRLERPAVRTDLLQAIESIAPRRGGWARRYRVEDEDLALAIRHRVGDGPEIEIRDVADLLALTQDGGLDGARTWAAADVRLRTSSPGLVRELAEAMARLDHAWPWSWLEDVETLRIDVPSLGLVGGTVAKFMGEERRGFGVFPRLDDEHDVYLGADDLPAGWLLWFEPTALLPEAAREDVADLGLESSRGRVGLLRTLGEDGIERRSKPRDYQLATAAVRALAGFVVRNRAELEGPLVSIDDRFRVGPGGKVPVHLAVDRSMFDDDLAAWLDLRVLGFSIAYERAISRTEADSAACVADALLDHAVRLLGRLPGPREWRDEWFEHVLTDIPADHPAAEIARADRERYLITYRQWLRLTGQMRDPTER